MTSLFDEHGRCVPVDSAHPVYTQSRRYFRCQQPAFNAGETLARVTNALGDPGLTAAEVDQRVQNLLQTLNGDVLTNTMTKGIHIPFVLPGDDDLTDMGAALQNRYLPAVGTAFASKLPEYTFSNQQNSDLTGCVSVLPDTRHDILVNALRSGPVVGVVFPCLSEYSSPAARERLSGLPDQFLLTGGVDLCGAFVSAPDVLVREDGYPPTFWMSALEGEKENIGYHMEAYGANLNFYRRAHLNQAAEYWWHSITVLG